MERHSCSYFSTPIVLATVTSYFSDRRPPSLGRENVPTEIAAQALKLVAFAVHRGLAHQPDQHGGRANWDTCVLAVGTVVARFQGSCGTQILSAPV